MRSDPRHPEPVARLVADLTALGRSLPDPAVDADRMARAVTARLAQEPARPAPAHRHPGTGSRLRTAARVTSMPTGVLARMLAGVRRPIGPIRAPGLARGRRRAVIAVVAVLLGLLGIPPVRAAVLDWFTVGAVEVRLDPGAPPVRGTPSPPPVADAGGSLAQARALVPFRPSEVPALGAPDGVEVSPDRRTLSTTWSSAGPGPIRLDQFGAQLDPAFLKTARGVEFQEVGGDLALWFDEPHEVVLLAGDGTARTETARLAGRTLIWQNGGTTLRLEGDLSLERALEIAGSARPLP